MVFDSLNNSDFYQSQHPLFEKAFAYLKTLTLAHFDQEKVNLQGEDCFVLFFKGKGRGAENILLEAHRKYIDIQLVFSGSDFIGFKALSNCSNLHTPYSEKDDYLLFKEELATQFKLPSNYFVIFYPDDAHAPLIGNEELLKAVVKVKVN